MFSHLSVILFTGQTPPRGYYGIRSTSGQYASYWNAYLFWKMFWHFLTECLKTEGFGKSSATQGKRLQGPVRGNPGSWFRVILCSLTMLGICCRKVMFLQVCVCSGGRVIPVSDLCNSSCGKVMLSQACVKNSVHRGWCILAFLWAIIPPGRPPLGRHHPRQTSPRQSLPPPKHCGIRSTFLFICSFQTKFLQIHRLVRPPRELAPPGKSWVRHCIVQQYIYRPQTMFAKAMFLHLSVILFTGPQCMLGYHTPPPRPLCRACWEIRSTSGRYVSYWNAILFMLLLFLIHSKLVNLFCFIQGINLPEL